MKTEPRDSGEKQSSGADASVAIKRAKRRKSRGSEGNDRGGGGEGEDRLYGAVAERRKRPLRKSFDLMACVHMRGENASTRCRRRTLTLCVMYIYRGKSAKLDFSFQPRPRV